MCRCLLFLSCIFIFIVSLTGCGVILNIPKECKNETPYTGAHNILFWYPEREAPERSTKEDFLKDWGKPDEVIHISENDETWVYKRKLWCGAIPFALIIPVPFILPVCDGFDRIRFFGNNATCLHTKHIVRSIYALVGKGYEEEFPCRYPVPSDQCVDSVPSRPPQ